MNKRLKPTKVKTQAFSLRDKCNSFASKANQNTRETFLKTYSTVNQYNPFAYSFRFSPLNRKIMPLLGPTAFAIGLSTAIFYEAPHLFSSTRLKYCKANPSNLMFTIMAINFIVFGFWQAGHSNNFIYRILNCYFWLNIRSIQTKTYIQMICVNWSHMNITQLLITMGFLYSFAQEVINILGVAHFMSLYLISGLCSSLASLYFGTHSPIGAAGSVSGIFAISATLFPKVKLTILGQPIPCDSSNALIGYTIFNIVGMYTKWGGMYYTNHLGGTFVGVLYGWYAKEHLISKWWFW